VAAVDKFVAVAGLYPVDMFGRAFCCYDVSWEESSDWPIWASDLPRHAARKSFVKTDRTAESRLEAVGSSSFI
jgi:hypothetical protein